jgi:hypothetical protein
MRRYNGNDKVKAGLYWTPARWEIVTIGKDGDVLPEVDRYVRLPTAVVMILGALLGALYVIFIPFIGFVMFLGFGAKKLWHLAVKAWNPEVPTEEKVRNTARGGATR